MPCRATNSAAESDRAGMGLHFTRIVVLSLLVTASVLPIAGSSEPLDYAIHTTIITDKGPRRGWLEIKGDCIVGIAGYKKHPVARHVIEYEGYAYPGLIDTHNHVDWNTISRWSAGHDWSNRYEWLKDPDYLVKVQGGKDSIKLLKPESVAYGEIRAITGGATMIQSRFDNYVNLIESNVGDLSLVFVKGKPVYGDPTLLKPLAPAAEIIDVGGLSRAVSAEATALKNPVLQLVEVLQKATGKLAPLFEK